MEMNSIKESTSLTEIEVENEVKVDSEILFRVGETFGNYKTLEKKLKNFEKASFSQFWKRDSRTVAIAKKRLDRPLSPALEMSALQINSRINLVKFVATLKSCYAHV